MLQADLIKPSEDVSTAEKEVCIVEHEEQIIEKPWLTRAPNISVCKLRRCLDTRLVPSVKEKILERPPRIDILDIDYPYEYEVEKVLQVPDRVCIKTRRGLWCGTHEELARQKYVCLG